VGLMRQRLQGFFPILLIALMVQIFAPIGATRTAAAVASDPLRLVEICHGGSGGPPSEDDRDRQHLHDSCVLCCVAQAAASLDAPRVTIVTAPDREVRRIVWHASALRLTLPRIGSNAKARAPPSAA
jgi:hypothetical protein